MKSLEDMFQKEIVYQYPKQNISFKTNLLYIDKSDKKDIELKFDIYYADIQNKKETSPTVILIHGEAPGITDMKAAGQYTSLGKFIASKGMNAITFNHRMLSNSANIFEILSDIRELLKYVYTNADKLGVDSNHIALWSFSAGVPFGLYTGLIAEVFPISCMVSYYGFGNFDTLIDCIPNQVFSKNIPSLNNLLQDKQILIPPMLIVQADLDNELLNTSMTDFMITALQNKASIELYHHQTGHHAFDILDDNTRSRQIIKETLCFLKYHLFLNVSC